MQFLGTINVKPAIHHNTPGILSKESSAPPVIAEPVALIRVKRANSVAKLLDSYTFYQNFCSSSRTSIAFQGLIE